MEKVCPCPCYMRYRFVVVLLIALIIGFIHGVHNILIPRQLKRIEPDKIYYPMTFESNYDVATFYAPRARAVMRGQINSGDIHLAEYPRAPSSVPFLPSLILGGTAKLLGSLERAIIVTDFLFPAITFILAYLLIFSLTEKHWLGVGGALLFIFIPGWSVLITSPSTSSWRELLQRAIPLLDRQTALPFLRFDWPKSTVMFYAAALFLLLQSLKQREKRAVFAAGISLGLLLYTYLYDGLYMFMGIVLLIAGLVIIKEYEKARKIFGVAAIAVLVSVPYWWNYFLVRALPKYNDILWRLGVEVSNAIRWSSWTSFARVLVLSVFLWVFTRKKDRVLGIYLISILVPIIFALNIQVITGINPAPDHWHRVQFLPVALALLLLVGIASSAAAQQFGRYKVYLRKAPMALVVIFLIVQLAGQWLFSTNPAVVARYGVLVKLRESYQWLNENTPRGSVIGTLSPETNADISMYTNNLLFIPKGLNSVAGTDELWTRTQILALILNLNAQEFTNLSGKESAYTGYVFGDFYRSRMLGSVFRGGSRDVPPEILNEKVLSYQNDKVSLPGYKLDYIYLGPRELALYQTEQPDFRYIFGEPLFDNGTVRIYRHNQLLQPHPGATSRP